MKVFWSWQSDIPGKTGRHFIRNVLKSAIDELSQHEDVEEPTERENRDRLHLDHDRQGEKGSPDLVITILKKIEQSAVFIADVTPVSVIGEQDGKPEKRNMNPNVAIELGYALKSLTDSRVLMVLNTFYGGREFLPFDLAHKAGPISFELTPTANEAEKNKVAQELKSKLVSALRPYLSEQKHEPNKTFRRIEPTSSPAVYFNPGQTLVSMGEDDDPITEYRYLDDRGFYLRLIPGSALQSPISLRKLFEEAKKSALRPMWRSAQGLYRQNKYGVIAWEPRSSGSDVIMASTQLFVNGEMWGIARSLLAEQGGSSYVPGQVLHQVYPMALRQYVSFMSNQLDISPPYSVLAGAVGLNGSKITIDDNVLNARGPIFDEDFLFEKVLTSTSPDAVDTFLLDFFDSLFGLTGYPRPDGLFGFP